MGETCDGGPPVLSLVPMTDAKFATYLARAVRDYADNFLFTLTHVALGAIGMLWFQLKERGAVKTAYLYDFSVREELRGQGHGRQALELLEVRLRELNVRSIGLNVFGYNHAARALYEKMGYQING